MESEDIKALGDGFLWLADNRQKYLQAAIPQAFPELESVWKDVNEAHFLLADLSKFVLLYLHQEALRNRFFSFVNEQYAHADYASRYDFEVYVFEDWLSAEPHRYFKFSLRQLMLENLNGKALEEFISMAKALDS
jgi:hypothetical protein